MYAPTDGVTGVPGTISNGGELVTVERHRVAGGVIGAALAPWYVDKSTGTGSVTVADGAATLSSGSGLNGVGAIESVHRGRVVLPQANHCTVVASVSGLTTNHRCRLGVFDSLDGLFWEVVGTTGWLVARKNGVDTRVTYPLDGPGPWAIDSLRHTYTIRYLVTTAFFIQDRSLVHRMNSTTTGPLVLNPDLPVRVECQNLTGTPSSVTLQVSNASISRLGTPLDASTSTITRVATSTASVQLLAADSLRKRAIIHNDSRQRLFVKYGAVASATSYTHILEPDDAISILDTEWSGRIDAILNANSGNAQVTATTE